MVIQLDESKLQPHVVRYFKMDAKRSMKHATVYCIKKLYSPSKLKAIFGKMLDGADKAYKDRSIDLEKLGISFTSDEVRVLVDMNRYICDKVQREEIKKYKIPKDVRIEKVDAKGVTAEWQTYPSARVDKVLFYIHGGGLMLHSAANYRNCTVEIARLTGVRVLSVDYRLYPEHKHPAHIDDVLAAYTWLLSTGIKPADVVVGGDSAGGLLTMRLLVRLRDEHKPLPAAAFCFSPLVDFSFSGKSDFENMPSDAMFGPTGSCVFFGYILKTTDPGASFTDPAISPLFASMAGLPPLLVQSTPVEMLYDDSRRLVEKAKAAGVDAELQTWDKMCHVFQGVGLNYGWPESREAFQKVADFVKKHLA